MGDLVWLLAAGGLMLIVGLVMIVMGWKIRKHQNMQLIIQYHCERVKEEDKKAYCDGMGAGVIVIGAGIFLSGALAMVFTSLAVFLPMLVGLLVGIGVLAFTIARYNRK